jgi:hypothetical protein
MTPTEALATMMANLEAGTAFIKDNPTARNLELFNRLMEETKAFAENTKAERMYDTSGPKQKQFMDYFRQTAHVQDGIHVYCARGANRSGKSCSAGACFVSFLKKHAKDGDVFYCVSPTEDKSRTGAGMQALIHRLLPSSMEESPYVFGRGYTNSTLLVRLPKPWEHNNVEDRYTLYKQGGLVQVKFKFEKQDLITFETDKIRGVLWDEARNEILFDTLLPRLTDQMGFLLITSIPRATYWLKKRVILPALDKSQPNYYAIELKMTDNALNLPKGAIEAVSNSLSTTERKMRVEGEDVSLEGLVFPQFKPERHVVARHNIPLDFPHWCAIDPGWATCAVVWMTKDTNGNAIVYREYQGHHETTQQICEKIKERSKEKIDGYFIDPQGMVVGMAMNQPVDLKQQFWDNGIPVQPWVRTGTHGKEAQVDRLRVFLENDAITIFADCQDLIRELQSWSYKSDAQDNPSDMFEKGSDHSTDCVLGLLSSGLSNNKVIVDIHEANINQKPPSAPYNIPGLPNSQGAKLAALRARTPQRYR